MDGSSPSGFSNSTYCGMTCTATVTPTPTPTPSPVTPKPVTPAKVDYSKVKVKSLKAVFSAAPDVFALVSLLWNNPWVFFVWFD